MSKVTLTDHAMMLCMLAEHQDTLEAEVDRATIDYMHATEFARTKLQKLRDVIDLRDAMMKARAYVGRSQ